MKKITLFLLLLVITLGVMGCNSMPDPIKGEPLSCFQFRACMKMNIKNHDKAVCVPFSVVCCDHLKDIHRKTIDKNSYK